MMKTQNEVLDRRYQALVNALGVVDRIRFIQHFNPGYGDYTKERHQWLDKLSLDDMSAEMRKYKKIDSRDNFKEVIE